MKGEGRILHAVKVIGTLVREPVQSGSKTSYPDSLNAHDAAYETSRGGSVVGLVTDHM
jgi:hypothetical protein